MKYIGVILSLIFGLWSCNAKLKQNDPEFFNKQTSNNVHKTISEIDNIPDLQYEISTNKEVYTFDEPIKITLIAKNITKEELKIWIDAGKYPVGGELRLLDSMGKSMVKKYWAFLSSQLYSREEVEQFKTTIPPGGEFKKEYNLLSIVQLKNDLTNGLSELSYNNAKPVKFEIK